MNPGNGVFRLGASFSRDQIPGLGGAAPLGRDYKHSKAFAVSRSKVLMDRPIAMATPRPFRLLSSSGRLPEKLNIYRKALKDVQGNMYQQESEDQTVWRMSIARLDSIHPENGRVDFDQW
jgi:hypothetical protein